MSMTKTRAFVIVLMMCFLMTNLLFGQTVSADPVSASSEPHADGGEITNAGLDLSAVDDPNVLTRYIAGEGYIDWDPASSVLTMHNADVSTDENVTPLKKALITLPESDVTIILEGENSIIRNYPEGVSSKADYAELIQQGKLVWASEGGEALEDVKEHSITIDGSGSLVVGSGDGELLIATDGTLLMKNGYLTASENCDASMILNIARFEQTGGRIYMNRGISVFEDISISGGYIIGAGEEFSALMTYGDISISGGVVDIAPANMACVIYVSGEFSHTGGQLRAMIGHLDVTSFSINFAVYGELSALQNMPDGSQVLNAKTKIDTAISLQSGIKSSYTIPTGNSLVLPADSRLVLNILPEQGLSDCLINKGTLLNDGQIGVKLSPEDTRTQADIAEMAAEITALLDPASTGQIFISNDEYNYLFSNRGEAIIEEEEELIIETDNFFVEERMRFFREGNDYVLELNNISLSGGLTLPSNTPIVIRSSGTVMIQSISFSGYYACDLTFAGGGVVTVNGAISSPINDDIISVVGGTRVYVNGGISIGGSAGRDGNLVVSGEGTRLSVDSDYGSAVYGGQVNVSDGAELIVNAEGTGVFANGGNVTISDRSKLTANCEYGVYMIGGSLILDETSTLITNGTIAPFCIVDLTGEKIQDEVLSLPYIPEGTEIVYETGSVDFNGINRNYWSLIPLGGILAVSEENNEPVTLTGAVKGLTTFANVPDVDDESAGNNDEPATDDGTASGGNPEGIETNSSTTSEATSTTDDDIDVDGAELPKTGERDRSSEAGIILLAIAFCCLTFNKQINRIIISSNMNN